MPIRARELASNLTRLGATLSSKRHGGGHRTIRYGDLRTEMPYHEGDEEISDPSIARGFGRPTR
jgi:hypothetical protein